MLTERQVPFTGPYAQKSAGPQFQHVGPTVEALQRALARLGYIDWVDFGRTYTPKVTAAMVRFQRQHGVAPASGRYGRGSWLAMRDARVPTDRPNAGQYALDRYARALIQAEEEIESESESEDKVRVAIAEWGRAIIANEPNIGYSQNRPVRIPQNPGGSWESDCSGVSIQAYAWARRKHPELNIPDPAKQRWSGFGNTDLFLDDHPKCGSPFRVGDLAHFHSPRHVIFCIKAGTVQTAEWCSHGQEAGPDLVRLATYSRFPDEFMGVVRPPLLEGGD